MGFSHKEEILEQLNQILESIRILEERNEEIHSIDDFLSSPMWV